MPEWTDGGQPAFPATSRDGTLVPVQAGSSSVFRILVGALGLALLGGLVLPITAYMAGKRVIGAYEGRLGLRDYLGSIYGGAADGDLLAWWLLLTPVLIAVAWYLVIRVARRLTA